MKDGREGVLFMAMEPVQRQDSEFSTVLAIYTEGPTFIGCMALQFYGAPYYSKGDWPT